MSINGLSAFEAYKHLNIVSATKKKVRRKRRFTNSFDKVSPSLENTKGKERSVDDEAILVKPPKKVKKYDSSKLGKQRKIKLLEQNSIISGNNKDDSDEGPPILIIPSQSQNIGQSFNNHTNSKKLKKQKKTHLTQFNEEELKADINDVPGNIVRKLTSPRDADDPMTEAINLFKWLISPCSPSEFFDKYWEREHLYIGRSKTDYYKHLFSTEKLDFILRNYPLHYGRNVDVVNYENGTKEVYNQEGRAAPSALWDFYSNNCSIRILNPHTYDQKIHLLIATLQEYFGTMVGTNVYLTPPGSQGFAPHYDDIEAFVVQLEGRKHWQLYMPEEGDVLARDSSPNLKHEKIGEPYFKVTLKAGDILYFPRGTIHEGYTDADSHSLHITVSVYQHTAYADLLEHILPAALKRAAADDLEFRKGLPVNYLKYIGVVNKSKTSEERSTVEANVKSLMKKLANYVDIDNAADQLGMKFMHDAMPPILSKKEVQHSSIGDGDFMKDGKVFNRVEISPDTEVRLLRYHCIRLVVDGSSTKVYYCVDNAKYYHGEEIQWLELDESFAPAIGKLQNSYPNYISVESLVVENSAQLVSDLWEKGLLVTKEPLPVFE